jgi:hypothetical protein
MLTKLQTALSTIKTNIMNTWNAIKPEAEWLGNAIAYILGLIAKLSNQLSLIIGIAIGYKLAPILRVISPLLRLVFDIVLIPIKILGWL